ncbi:MAG TPA: DnaJ domain-containing protein [Pyrinomonadaceae bacterium]|nr:DnaJ domain-containing protein [Pyrinomonadaceae bacterium]
MSQESWVDYYEVLQVSTNAEPETINRVYRMLAQRFHPDNRESGDEKRFREILEAYKVLSDPEERARYDVAHQKHRNDRWRLVTAGAQAENDFEMEQVVRLTVLEALYTRRRLEPDDPGIFWLDLEKMMGRPREHLVFTLWFLMQKKLVERGDNSRVLLTAEGAEYLEQNYRTTLQRKRLPASSEDS